MNRADRSTLRGAAIEAVRKAARLTRAVQEERAQTASLSKQDRSPVTVADYGAQAVVSLTLRAIASDVPVVGEENADALRSEEHRELCDAVVTHVRAVLPDVSRDVVLRAIDACSDQGGGSGLRWVLDPIDGTKGYLREGQYAIALALLEDGQPVLGVLGCPALASANGGRGCLFVAERGRGAAEMELERGDDGSVDPARAIHVSPIHDAGGAVFCESVEAAHSAHDRHARIGKELGVTSTPLRMDSQCKYAAVARGDASIYLRFPKDDTYREKIWDHAAGWIVITEAGGHVSDVDGKPLDFSLGRTLASNRGIIATNGHLHHRVLEAVRATA